MKKYEIIYKDGSSYEHFQDWKNKKNYKIILKK